MKQLIIFLAVLALTSCVSERKRAKICKTCPQKEVTTDSTWYKMYITYRDSVIAVEKDSAMKRFVISPCPDGSIPKITETESKDGRKTIQEVTIKGNILEVRAKVKEENIPVQLPTTTIEKGRDKKTVLTLPCEEKWHEDYFYYAGILFHILLFLGAVYGAYWNWKRRRDGKV